MLEKFRSRLERGAGAWAVYLIVAGSGILAVTGGVAPSQLASASGPASNAVSPPTRPPRLHHLRRFNIGLAGFGTYNRSRGPQDGGAPQTVLRASPPKPRAFGSDVATYRTANSRTDITPAGVYVTRVYQAPVNYRDAHGQWQPINDSLTRVAGGYSDAADSYRVLLPDDLAAPVRLASDVSLRLLGAQSHGRIAGAEMTYSSALRGISVSYTAAPGRLKEAISLAGSAAVRPITYDLSLGRGLVPELTESGELEIRDSRGRPRIVMPAPFMYEQSQPSGSHGDVRTTLRRSNRGWSLTLTPDRRWLEAPRRTWPVVIDPTAVYPGSIDEDCTIEGPPSAGSNFCNSTTNQVGRQGNPAQPIRTLYHFNVAAAIPADAVVTQASLNETIVGAQNSTNSLAIRLDELGPHAFNRNATWNTYDATDSWTTPGGDVSDTYVNALSGGTGSAQTVPPTTGPLTIGLATFVVQNWLDGSSPNDGLLERADDETTTTGQNVLQLASVLSTSNQPYLQVSWTPRLGAPRGATLDTAQLSDRMSMGVNVANGNLLVNNSDLNVAGTGLPAVFGHALNNLSPSWSYGEGPQPGLSNVAADGSLDYTGPDGATYVLQPNGGGWNSAEGFDGTTLNLTTGCGSSPKRQVQFQNGQTQNFDGGGGLVCEQDQNGNTITYVRDSSDRVSSETDTQGRTINFSYCGNTLCTVTETAGNRSVSFSGANPTTFTDAAGNHTQYSFNPTGTLQKLIDPAGEVTTFAYDSGNRLTSYTRITNATTGTGDTTTFAYHAPGTTIPALATGCPAPIPTTDQPTPYPLYGQTVETDSNGHTTTYCYDTHDRVTATVDGRGHLWQTGYDLDDNVEKTLDPYGHSTTQTFDHTNTPTSSSPAQEDRPRTSVEPASGGGQNPATGSSCYVGGAGGCDQLSTSHSIFYPDSQTDPENNLESFTYDANSNLQQISTPLNSVVIHHNLSNHGLVDYTQDGNGNTTNYGYDGKGNLTSITPPLPLGADSLGYDAVSRVTSYTDGKTQTTQYHYDPLDRVSEIDYADGSSIKYTYDADGNVTQRVDSRSGTSTYTFDLKNRLVKEASPNVTNSYTYDPADNLTSLTDAGGTVTYTYDAANNVLSAQEPGPAGNSIGAPNPITFSYDNANRRTCTLYPNGVVILDTYDPAGHVLSINSYNKATACAVPSGGVQLTGHTYTYAKGPSDTDLRQTQSGLTPTFDSFSNSWGWTSFNRSYTYDALNRLTDVHNSGDGYDWTYSYDAAGNILTVQHINNSCPTTCQSSSQSYTYNAANEITNSGYAYDGNGNETHDGINAAQGGNVTLQYNARNQTTAMAGMSLAYLGGDQTQLTAANGNTYTNNTLGISAQFQPVSGFGLSSPKAYYTRDPSGTLLSERTSGALGQTPGSAYDVTDANGTVDVSTGQNGSILDGVTYDDPYGGGESGDPTFGFDGGLTLNNAMSGVNGTKFGSRYQDNHADRWTQPDPIRQAPDPVNSDPYVFAGDDPVNQTDPSGNCPLDPLDSDVGTQGGYFYYRICKHGRTARLIWLRLPTFPYQVKCFNVYVGPNGDVERRCVAKRQGLHGCLSKAIDPTEEHLGPIELLDPLTYVAAPWLCFYGARQVQH